MKNSTVTKISILFFSDLQLSDLVFSIQYVQISTITGNNKSKLKPNTN